jgi:hypothetical protein
MRLLILLAIAGLSALASCERKAAWDSRNPVHCMTIFGVAGAGGAAQSRTELVDDMNARMSRLAEQNGGAAWVRDITPTSRQLANQIKAAAGTDRAALVELFEQCMAQHPARAD